MADDLDRILKDKYTTCLRPGYKWFDDIFMLTTFPNYADRIRNFHVRDDDIWVSSFAKAGTTWTQEMVWLIANDLDYEGAKTLLPERFPFLDLSCVLDFQYHKDRHPEFECPESMLDPIGYINKLKSRRFIKTHLPWKYLPLQIQNQTTKAKLIHVIRNPKDICVSLHYHTHVMEAATGTLEDCFRLFMAGKVAYGPFWDNILSFWNRRHLPNILVISYEDMKKDLPSVIRKVAKFLGKEVNDDQMEKLTKHLSFEQMKTNTAVNFEPLISYVKQCTGDASENKGSFMRSGQAGNYKVEMTQEMIEIMDKWIEEHTVGTDLTFNIP
ncbi:hypothetical protein Trydic_g9971 [Trypoxylus dichotomus]